MEIGVDVDGVLADQVVPVLDRLHTEHRESIIGEKGRCLQKSDIIEWDQPIPGTDTDIKREIETSLQNPEFVRSMPLIEGAKPILRDWTSRGISVTIATHRPHVSNDATKDWLDSHSIPYDRYVNTSDQSKAELDIDILIDDYPGNVVGFIGSDRPCIMLLQPWNQNHQCTDHSLTYCAKTWGDVHSVVEELR